MQIHENENSSRAYYNLTTNITLIMITETSSAKTVNNGAAWHQRSSWAQPLGTSTRVTSTSQHQIFDEKFDQKPESVRIKMADLAGR